MCWVGVLDGHPVAMTAAFPFAPNFISLGKQGMSSAGSQLKTPQVEFLQLPDSWTSWGMFREHRTVVLPDYQGTGLGSAMSDAVAHDLELRKVFFYLAE